MKAIEPLESLNRRIHTIADTEIMPFNIYCDIARYALGGSTDGHKMRVLHTLRNSVISRSPDVFVDMVTFTLQQHQLELIKSKKMSNSDRTLSISFLICIVAFIACLCLTWMRIERLEQKVEKLQQQIGNYEGD